MLEPEALTSCTCQGQELSFEFQEAVHFNKLPENIRVLKDCKLFKTALHKSNNTDL